MGIDIAHQAGENPIRPVSCVRLSAGVLDLSCGLYIRVCCGYVNEKYQISIEMGFLSVLREVLYSARLLRMDWPYQRGACNNTLCGS